MLEAVMKPYVKEYDAEGTCINSLDFEDYVHPTYSFKEKDGSTTQKPYPNRQARRAIENQIRKSN